MDAWSVTPPKLSNLSRQKRPQARQRKLSGVDGPPHYSHPRFSKSGECGGGSLPSPRRRSASHCANLSLPSQRMYRHDDVDADYSNYDTKGGSTKTISGDHGSLGSRETDDTYPCSSTTTNEGSGERKLLAGAGTDALTLWRPRTKTKPASTSNINAYAGNDFNGEIISQRRRRTNNARSNACENSAGTIRTRTQDRRSQSRPKQKQTPPPQHYRHRSVSRHRNSSYHEQSSSSSSSSSLSRCRGRRHYPHRQRSSDQLKERRSLSRSMPRQQFSHHSDDDKGVITKNRKHQLINLAIDDAGKGKFHIATRSSTRSLVSTSSLTKQSKSTPSSYLTFHIQIDEPTKQYIIHASMGRLDEIRDLHPEVNILRTLSTWNELQKLRRQYFREDKDTIINNDGAQSDNKEIKGGQLVIAPAHIMKASTVGGGRKKSTDVVMMTLMGKYRCRTWEHDAHFQRELERFVEDALQFHVSLNDSDGGGVSKNGCGETSDRTSSHHENSASTR